MAELVSNTIRNPFEVVKQQMQIGLDTNLADTVSNIYRLRGIRGFWAGYFSLICREIPFSAIQLPVYETMKIVQKNYNKKVGWTGGLTWYQDALNGCTAGFVASALTTPIDVIKTKIMVSRTGEVGTIKGTLDVILAEEGVRGLFRAWHIRCFSISIVSIFFFSGYEFFKKSLVTK